MYDSVLWVIRGEEVVMAGAGVGASSYTLLQLFEGRSYQIDVYQREYAWGADEVRALVDDLWNAHEAFERASRRGKEQLFLGPFVYVDGSGKSRYLVDGQQRFTTLHLILLHLHRIADAQESYTLAGKLHQLVYAFFEHGRPTRYRLDIAERREALDALYDRRPFAPGNNSLSVKNVWERGSQVQELLDERINSDNCARFVDWLLTRVVLVGIKAPDRAGGYRIFESMNVRGTRLTPVDLLKSYLLREVGSPEHEQEVNQDWRTMLANLTAAGRDQEAPSKFLKAALLAHWARAGSEIARDAEDIDIALHLWVKDNGQLLGLDQGPGSLAFMKKLIKLADHYARFLRAAASPDSDKDLQGIYFNQVNGLSTQMPLLLAAVDPADPPQEAKDKAALAANFVDLLYVDRVFRDEPADPQALQDEINVLLPVLRKAHSVDAVRRVLSEALPQTDPFQQVATFSMRGNNRRQIRYVLARLTAFVQQGYGRPAPVDEHLGEQRGSQIEHIFANHPERYRAEVPDPVSFRALRNRIGVLLLLNASENASYNDLPYEEKVCEYYQRENQLAAVLVPNHAKHNPARRRFVTKYALEKTFHDYGRAPEMIAVVQGRGELYQQLCRRVWATEETGLDLPWELAARQPSVAQPVQNPNQLVSEEVEQVPEVAPPADRVKRRGPMPQFLQLVEAGALKDGTVLRGTNSGKTYLASIYGDRIRVDATGEAYRLPDEAAAVVRGRKNVAGMTFWCVEKSAGQWVSLRNVYDEWKRASSGNKGGKRRRS